MKELPYLASFVLCDFVLCVLLAVSSLAVSPACLWNVHLRDSRVSHPLSEVMSTSGSAA